MIVKGAWNQLLKPGLAKGAIVSKDATAKGPYPSTSLNYPALKAIKELFEIDKDQLEYHNHMKYIRARLLAGEFTYHVASDTVVLSNGEQVSAEFIAKTEFLSASDIATFRWHLKKKAGHASIYPGKMFFTDPPKPDYAELYGMSPQKFGELMQQNTGILNQPIDTYRPPKDNLSKDRQIAVLKAMLAAVIVSKEDPFLDITEETLAEIQRELNAELIYYPKELKYRLRIK